MRALRRLIAIVRGSRLDEELAEEIRQHLDLRRQALIDDGMDPREADAEARRRFGNPTALRERAGDVWRFPRTAALFQDLRFAARLMRRRPLYSAIVIVTVALGTGLNGAVFVLFNAALLRTPDVLRAGEVVRLDEGKPIVGPPYPDYVDYRDRASDAVDLATFSGIGVTARFERAGGRTDDRVRAVLVSGNYFDVLGVRALAGRMFTGRDDLPPLGTPVVVLGEDYWARRFNRDQAVIGQSIDLNRQPFTIVGIAPASFRGVDIAGAGAPSVREMYVPLWSLPLLQPGDIRLRERTTWWGLQAIGRLRPGVTVEHARARIAAIAAALDREYPGLRHERRPHLGLVTRVDVRLLMGEAGLVAGATGLATLLVLLIACANVANLALARACGRSREIAVRLSLGAARGRIVRQFITESLLLASCGTALGFALAHAALRIATTNRDAQPFVLSLTPDATVLMYAACVAALVAAVTGIVPAVQASKPSLLPALKDSIGTHRLGRFRAVFVGGEVAVTLVLLVATALLLRSAGRAAAIDPVLPAAQLLSVDANSEARDAPRGSQAPLLSEIQRRIDALPGVVGTAFAKPMPFSGHRHGTTLRPVEAAEGPGLRVLLSSVSRSFFQLTNLAIVRGVAFEEGAHDEVVVNSALARQLWGDADPIGRRVTAGDFDRTSHVVVGVVSDAPFVSLQLRAEPFMFRPIELSNGGSIAVRTSGPAAALTRVVTAAVGDVDPQLTVNVEGVADGIAEEIGAVRVAAGLVGGVGALAMLLALFGVGAVTANAVAQRTHEIGVRMALGARAPDAVALVVRQTIRPVVAGVALGLIASGLLSRLVAAQLYGLSSVDTIAFG
jgi:putative ABC transport system permease protein